MQSLIGQFKMAQFKADFQSNSENRNVGLFPSKSLDESARKHASKKQAFVEIKNVMHNQQNAPKGSGKNDSREHEAFFQNVTNLKQKYPNEAEAKLKSAKKLASSSSLLDDSGIEMLNYYDYEKECCRQPYKSDRRTWADMNTFEDALLDKIIQSAFAGDEFQTPNANGSFDLDKSDSEDCLDVNNSSLYPIVFSEHDDSLDDIFLPPVDLEKFDLF